MTEIPRHRFGHKGNHVTFRWSAHVSRYRCSGRNLRQLLHGRGRLHLCVHQHIASFPAAQVPFHRGLRDPQVIILNPPAAAAEAPADHLIQAITGNRLALELNEIVAGMHAVLNCVANGNGVWERDLNQIRDLNFA